MTEPMMLRKYEWRTDEEKRTQEADRYLAIANYFIENPERIDLPNNYSYASEIFDKLYYYLNYPTVTDVMKEFEDLLEVKRKVRES